MRAVLRPTSAGSNEFDYKQPPEPTPEKTPQAPGGFEGERTANEPPQVKPRRWLEAAKRFVKSPAGAAAALALIPSPRNGAQANSGESQDDMIETARSYASPPAMPGPSPPVIPPMNPSMPVAPSVPNYAAMSADANMGLYDLISQSQTLPPDAGNGESIDPYIHGGD